MSKRSTIVLIIFLLNYSIPVFSQDTTPTLPSPFPAVKGSGIFDKGEGLGGDEKRKFLHNQNTKELEYVPGELLVKFRPGISRHLAQATHRFYGSRTVKRFGKINVDHIKIPEGWSLEKAITVYRLDPDVEYAEPNYIRRSFLMPNDPDFDKLWGLHNTGQEVNETSATVDADIDAPEVWDTQTGSSSVVIAVIDTGSDWNHEDLSDNIWSNSDETPDNGIDDDGNGYTDDSRGWDFVNGDNDPDDDNDTEDYYHGTHVSGIIAAKGNNGVGITGVCWSASIMLLKILDAGGNGTVADEIDAIMYAVNNGAKIINVSFGGSGSSLSEYDAIDHARKNGVLFVAAAGNDGDGNQESGWNNDQAGQEIYPASYDLNNIISVAAADYHDDLALWSNYGPTSVDVAAPGADIFSTKAGNGYRYLSGSSMAAPHVSGLAALIWADDNSLTCTQVKDRILNGVDPRSSMDGKILTGGRINAKNTIPPSPPTNLAAISVSSTQIDLVWTDTSSGEAGFRIERKTGLGEIYSQIATVATDAESYSDTGLSESTAYYYRVMAYNSSGNSSYSNEVNATTCPASPSDLSATAGSISQIDLIWNDNSSGEAGFMIERKTGSGATYSQIATVDADVTTFSDTGLSEGTRYYYRVLAYSSACNSGYSDEASDITFFSSSGSDSRCFIATALYGSEDHPDVKILRDFRDTYLLDNPIGRKFVQIYYLYSPSLADRIEYNRSLRALVRHALIPIIISSAFALHAGPLEKCILYLLLLFLAVRFCYPRFLKQLLLEKRD